MPLDPRIALQGIGFQAPDILGAVRQGQDIRKNNMAMRAEEAAAQRNAMVRGRSAKVDYRDPNSVNKFVQFAGPDATPYLEAASAGQGLATARGAERRAQGEFDREERGANSDFIVNGLGAVYNDPSDANIAAISARAIAMGIPEDQMTAYSARLLAVPEADRRGVLANELATTPEGLKLLERFAPNYDYQNAGGSLVPVQTNPLVPGATPPQPIAVTPDPTKYTDVPTENGIVRVYADGRSEALVGPDGQPLAPALSPAERRAEREAGDAEVADRGRNVTAYASTQNTRRLISEAIPLVSHMSAGLLSGTAVIGGTPAADLRGALTSISANLAFGELARMRAESETGGALGQVVVRELELLESVRDSVLQSQSPEQLRSGLRELDRQLLAVERAYANMIGFPPVGEEGSTLTDRQTGRTFVSDGSRWVAE